MTVPGAIKPTHKAIKAYREALDAYAGQQVKHEGATETAFQRLLSDTARAHGWMLVPKLPIKRGGKSSARTVQLLDDYPTLAELCGLTPPDGLEAAAALRDVEPRRNLQSGCRQLWGIVRRR